MTNIPDFGFVLPHGYTWLAEKGLVGFGPGSSFEPWYFLNAGELIELNDRWPAGPSTQRLVAFARRQDCDDLACFEVKGGIATRVVLVHGWTPQGYGIVTAFDDFWQWLRAIVDDIQDWAESSD